MGSYSFIVIQCDNKIMNSGLAKISHVKKFSGLISSRNLASSSISNPIFELRTYDLVPKDVGKFLALSKEKFHLRTQHSVLLGYWTAELGGDAAWQEEYFQQILPWL